MSITDKTLDIILHVDEAQAPLARGQRISGKIIAMIPESRPPGKRDALILPEGNFAAVLQGSNLYVTPRYRDESWDDFRAGKEITVNVTVLDSQKNEVARGIGHVHMSAYECI